MNLTTLNVAPHLPLVRLEGDVDLDTADAVQYHLDTLIDRGARHLVLDLEGVGYVDSAGLATLIAVLRRLKKVRGRLTVVCTQRHLLRIFELTGLDTLFEIVSGVEAIQ